MNAQKRTRKGRRERGAVLILTVVVIMVLTTLGMAMVTFTGTEERTATTYRDSLQVRAVAESGVRIAQQMFQNPTDARLVPVWGASSSGTPTPDYFGTTETAVEDSLNDIGIFRDERTGATPARYTGPGNAFFQPPYRGSWANLFGGKYEASTNTDISDLRFRRTDDDGDVISGNWLDEKVNPLFADPTDFNTTVGRITEIAFYQPPIVNNRAYGIATVRVTAEKVDARGRLLARETIEALLGDNNITPSMLGNGNIVLNNIDTCGNGCEQIHANGNVTIGNGTLSGGNPPVTAEGTVTGGSITPPARPLQPEVTAPEINPWDTTYTPTGSDLNKYYLLTTRPPRAEFLDDVASNNPLPVICGLATCQDYGMEYTGTTARVRTGVGYLYKWDTDANQGGWDLVDDTTAGGNNLVSNAGGESFTITFVNGTDISITSPNDPADPPFNENIVPAVAFRINGIAPNNDSADAQLATFLVDGRFEMENNIGNPRPWKVTIIAVGSITTSSSTDIRPATASRYMLISGRDIRLQGSYLNDLHFCGSHGIPTSDPSDEAGMASGIVACHEGFRCQSNSDPMGIIIAESAVSHDPTVNNASTAISFEGGSTNHSYVCGFPEWPWTRPTKPVILSMNTASN